MALLTATHKIDINIYFRLEVYLLLPEYISYNCVRLNVFLTYQRILKIVNL
jgi:hypothetical protein